MLVSAYRFTLFPLALGGREYRWRARQGGPGQQRFVPRQWMNVRQLSDTSVLVPNWPETPEISDNMKYWGVMIYDPSLGSSRPVIFSVDPYFSYEQPVLLCITDRGECVRDRCQCEDHHCKMYYNDDEKRGGRHYFCECESK